MRLIAREALLARRAQLIEVGRSVFAKRGYEATLRGVLREILPNVMLDVAMKPPS